MSNSIKDKVVLVTGGSSGIGEATALLFAEQGAKVAIASRNMTKANKVLKKLHKIDESAIWIKTDVMDSKQVSLMVKKVVKTFGRLDIAFNNASQCYSGNLIEDIKETSWENTIQGTLNSVFYCMKYEIKAMQKNGCGVIVNNSSVDGKKGFTDLPAYCAAKHGVIGLTKASAKQYISNGIRINAICPGWVATPPMKNWIKNNSDIRERVISEAPINRMANPKEIANAVLWLCSDASSFVVGTALDIDGGYLA